MDDSTRRIQSMNLMVTKGRSGPRSRRTPQSGSCHQARKASGFAHRAPASSLRRARDPDRATFGGLPVLRPTTESPPSGKHSKVGYFAKTAACAMAADSWRRCRPGLRNVRRGDRDDSDFGVSAWSACGCASCGRPRFGRSPRLRN